MSFCRRFCICSRQSKVYLTSIYDSTVRYKILERENLANCKRIANISLSKIFSFKKLVIRIYAICVCVSNVDGVVEIF